MQKIYAFIPHFSFASRFRLLLLLLSRLCLPFFFFFACLSCAPVYAILASFARFKYFQSNLTRMKKTYAFLCQKSLVCVSNTQSTILLMLPWLSQFDAVPQTNSEELFLVSSSLHSCLLNAYAFFFFFLLLSLRRVPSFVSYASFTGRQI